MSLNRPSSLGSLALSLAACLGSSPVRPTTPAVEKAKAAAVTDARGKFHRIVGDVMVYHVPGTGMVLHLDPEGDSDGDRFKNWEDKCPTDPSPYDEGCPPSPNYDFDDDGAPNRKDACPSDPGPADNNGCPPSPPDPAN